MFQPMMTIIGRQPTLHTRTRYTSVVFPLTILSPSDDGNHWSKHVTLSLKHYCNCSHMLHSSYAENNVHHKNWKKMHYTYQLEVLTFNQSNGR
jgi:hypothetical protein